MIHLENEQVKLDIARSGAELQRIFHKGNELEYLWNGDPAHWGKHAPVLFPVVGQLKDNTYQYKGRSYSLNRHGFAREKEFTPAALTDDAVTLELQSDEETKLNYPFDFILAISYSLQGAALSVGYEVINTGQGPMYFSIGAHPAFSVPLVPGTAYSDYYLEFDQAETAARWPLLDGLVKTQPQPFIRNAKRIPLSHELFYEDALIFKDLQSTAVSIKSEHTGHGLTLDFEGFPYLGIWAAENAPFVCIEPWCGIADAVYHNQQLTEKEGIMALDPGASWKNEFKISFF